MTTADDLFNESVGNIRRLGLREIPFTESPPPLGSQTLKHIFTGRTRELRQVFNLFQSRERRRILVYGQLGIGKSIFLLEVLSVLERQRPKMLTTYFSLPDDLDLATTAIIALAREMSDDDWAQRQLYQMGIPTDRPVKDRNSEIGGSMGLSGKMGEKDLPIVKPQYPTVSFETLLARAQKKYPDGILIAIDDLDKQNPRQVRQLMHDAQGMLKGPAWFMLTGHPTGITEDLLTSERGLFDLQLLLTELNADDTYQMLINYLSSARIDNDCSDRDDPRAVLPFLPETAERFCEVSRGKPRLFNRLGSVVLSTAADLQADIIDGNVLNQGFKAASRTLQQQAALDAKTEQVRLLLQQRGSLSDEAIAMADLERLGFRSFIELLPFLERLKDTDLAHQLPQGDTTVFEAIPLPSGDDDENEVADPDDTPDEIVLAQLRQGLQEALTDRTLPRSQMWEGIDAN